MYICFSTLLPVAALAAVAAAAPTALEARNSTVCNTGTGQCCNTAVNPAELTPAIVQLLQDVGINAANLTGYVGLECSPIAVIGISSTSCNTTPLCCANELLGGTVDLDCSPINVSL